MSPSLEWRKNTLYRQGVEGWGGGGVQVNDSNTNKGFPKNRAQMMLHIYVEVNFFISGNFCFSFNVC